MEEDLTPYTESFELKQLGFNETCFGYFYTEDMFFDTKIKNSELEADCSIARPTFSQAFRWFREKYNKDSFIARCNSTKEYFFDISWRNKKGLLKDFQSKDFKTHPEAELECLKKLIKITKEKLAQPK